jgi:hypothetical protein
MLRHAVHQSLNDQSAFQSYCIEPLLQRHGRLVPAIYVLLAKAQQKGVDARDRRGHDDVGK